MGQLNSWGWRGYVLKKSFVVTKQRHKKLIEKSERLERANIRYYIRRGIPYGQIEPHHPPEQEYFCPHHRCHCKMNSILSSQEDKRIHNILYDGSISIYAYGEDTIKLGGYHTYPHLGSPRIHDQRIVGWSFP